MRAILFALAAFLLVACGEEPNPILGKWRGTITDAQRAELDITTKLPNDRLELEFHDGLAVLNGQEVKVDFQRNNGVYYAVQIKTNRTFAMLFRDDGRVIFRAPKHHTQGIMEFTVERDGEPPVGAKK